MAVMRDRIRILAALLAAPLVGFGSQQAAAGSTTASKKKVTKKKATKKKATKKKAKKKVAKRKTKKKATKKKAKKKVAKRKTKKKVAKKKVTRVSEPGTLALMGSGLVAAGVMRKLGSRRKNRQKK